MNINFWTNQADNEVIVSKFEISPQAKQRSKKVKNNTKEEQKKVPNMKNKIDKKIETIVLP